MNLHQTGWPPLSSKQFATCMQSYLASNDDFLPGDLDFHTFWALGFCSSMNCQIEVALWVSLKHVATEYFAVNSVEQLLCTEHKRVLTIGLSFLSYVALCSCWKNTKKEEREMNSIPMNWAQRCLEISTRMKFDQICPIIQMKWLEGREWCQSSC